MRAHSDAMRTPAMAMSQICEICFLRMPMSTAKADSKRRMGRKTSSIRCGSMFETWMTSFIRLHRNFHISSAERSPSFAV